MADFIPKREEQLGEFSTNIHDAVAADPDSLGCTAADATDLNGAILAFVASLATARNPQTRTPVAIIQKDTDKARLVSLVRMIAKKIQAQPTVTPAQKMALGLTVPDRTPTPVQPPATKPLLSVVTKGERTVELRMVDETTPTRRSRPETVTGAMVYTYVGNAGELPPADLTKWQVEGVVTRNEFVLAYKPEDLGKTAHVRARWLNGKGQTGPASDPVITMIAA